MAFIVLHDKKGREILIQADDIVTAYKAGDESGETLVYLSNGVVHNVSEGVKDVVAMTGLGALQVIE